MKPLADLLRPQNLQDFIGQSHLVGDDKPIKKVIEDGRIFSIIFWGPPGVGKTTLAQLIAKAQDRELFHLSAVSAGKNDVKEVILKAQNNQQDLLGTYNAPILFLDEIHRFNKAQQDYLLPYVEDGTIILIGATTENPSFEVISPLLSRCRVFILKPLLEDELNIVLDRIESYFQHLGKKTKIAKTAREWLINYSAGDARKILTIADNAFNLYGNLQIESLKNTLQSDQLRYDKHGEEHFDTISAFIKSMRASNTDAALYYLARMVDAGEDPKFIARRMIIFASEDIGLAQPTALVVANAVFEAVTKIGYPEAQINLAHAAAYLCQAKKDRSAYDAYFLALEDVKKFGNLPIPLELRNPRTKLLEKLDYGKGYQMYPAKDKSLLPEKLKDKKYLKIRLIKKEAKS